MMQDTFATRKTSLFFNVYLLDVLSVSSWSVSFVDFLLGLIKASTWFQVLLLWHVSYDSLLQQS